jgi:hypothetical protein
MEATLLSTLDSIRIRSQVEDCLKEIVTDIEISQRLEERLNSFELVQDIQKRLASQQAAIEECYLEKEEKNEKQKALADKLVLEIWALSEEIGSLKATKILHDELVATHDEVLAKLMQAELDLEEAKRGGSGNRMTENAKTDGFVVSECSSQQKAKEKSSDGPAKSETNPLTICDETARPTEPSTQPPKAVVSLVEESTVDTHPQLAELDTKILMNIFCYLDALDILNVAQVNLSMYSRIDTLFGTSHDDTSTIATNETPPRTANMTAPTQTSTLNSTLNNNAGTIAQLPPMPISKTNTPNTASTSAKGIAPVTEGTPFVKEPTPASASASSSVTTGKTNPVGSRTAESADGPLALFSNFMQQHRKSTSSSPTRGLKASNKAYQPMNATMANSMAAKLSDAELNAIILMTERLKQKEALADKLMRENEEIAAKLDGTQAVKHFLINKVRDMELGASYAQENEVKLAHQIASDQEVIAFLDNRVQELERQERITNDEKQKALEKLDRIQEQSEKKSAVMGDMLQYEREKLNENEREWKAAKKLLIKEVKHCRNQIFTLQAERDSFREQNQRLRHGVLTPAGLSSQVSARSYS